jgi:hypothetical protein
MSNKQTIRSIFSSMSILVLSLACIIIAVSIPFIPIIIAQEEGGDLVEMEMNNGTTISVANGSGMILGDGMNVIENGTITVMENGTIQSEDAF